MTRAARLRRILAASAFSAFLFAGLAAAGSNPSSGFTPDKGTFKILVNGAQMGKEDFDISPGGASGDWIARGTSEITAPDGKTSISGSLEFRPDGTPVRYEWSTQGAKKAGATITFNGPVASIELHVANARPFTQQLTFGSPQIVILDNNLYYQYAVLAHLYDWQKKGSQTFSVLVPQELTPGTITAQSLGSQDVDGKKLEELSVKTEDLEVDVYLEGQRVVRIVAPSSNAEIVRQ
ncbi:MAG TPA: hypothetical protein VHX36_02235 [Candidatus Acidoferrales bacterium]|nr:hypothetical protein [Candidatus Acidoferrales bacterium]